MTKLFETSKYKKSLSTRSLWDPEAANGPPDNSFLNSLKYNLHLLVLSKHILAL